MASEAIIQQIDEKFLQCAICMDQLREPKMLPCGHQYCRDCLEDVSKQIKDGKCPTCRRKYKLPPGGVDELITDYKTKGLTDYVQWHSKEENSAPRCQDHPKKFAELCCMSCSNQPICVKCTCAAHKGHDFEDMTTLAAHAREELKGKLENLLQYKCRVITQQEAVKKAKRALDHTVAEQKHDLLKERELETNRIKQEISDKDVTLQEKVVELEGKLKQKIAPAKKQLEREKKQAQEKYDRAYQKQLQIIESEFQKIQQKHLRIKKQLAWELDDMNEGIEESLKLLEEKEKENSEIEERSKHFDDIAKTLEDMTVTASNLLAEKYTCWRHIQEIPGICSGIDSLIEEEEMESEKTHSISDLFSSMVSSFRLFSGMSANSSEEVEESVMETEGDGVDRDSITGGVQN